MIIFLYRTQTIHTWLYTTKYFIKVDLVNAFSQIYLIRHKAKLKIEGTRKVVLLMDYKRGSGIVLPLTSRGQITLRFAVHKNFEHSVPGSYLYLQSLLFINKLITNGVYPIWPKYLENVSFETYQLAKLWKCLLKIHTGNSMVVNFYFSLHMNAYGFSIFKLK